METKRLFETMTYKIQRIYEREKSGNQRYVKTYLLLEEVYNFGKKSIPSLHPTSGKEHKR